MADHYLNLPTESDLRSSLRLQNELNQSRISSPYPQINVSRPKSGAWEKPGGRDQNATRETGSDAKAAQTRRPSAQALYEFRRGIDRGYTRRRGDSLPNKSMLVAKTEEFQDYRRNEDLMITDESLERYDNTLEHVTDVSSNKLTDYAIIRTTEAASQWWTSERIAAWLSDNGFGQEWQNAMQEHAVQHESFLALTSYPRVRKIAPPNISNSEMAIRLCNSVRKLVDQYGQIRNDRAPGSWSTQSHIELADVHKLPVMSLHNSPQLIAQRQDQLSSEHKKAKSADLSSPRIKGEFQDLVETQSRTLQRTHVNDSLSRVADWALRSSQAQADLALVAQDLPNHGEVLPDNLRPHIDAAYRGCKNILITTDHIIYRRVDLSQSDPDSYLQALQPSHLGLRNPCFYISAVGGAVHDHPLTESQILQVCNHADHRGQLVLFLSSYQSESRHHDVTQTEDGSDRSGVLAKKASGLNNHNVTPHVLPNTKPELVSTEFRDSKLEQLAAERKAGFKVLRPAGEIDFDIPRSSPYSSGAIARNPSIYRNDSKSSLVPYRTAPKLPPIVTQDRIERTLSEARRIEHTRRVNETYQRERGWASNSTAEVESHVSSDSGDGLWAQKPAGTRSISTNSTNLNTISLSSQNDTTLVSNSFSNSGAMRTLDLTQSPARELQESKNMSVHMESKLQSQRTNQDETSVRPTSSQTFNNESFLRHGIRPPTDLLYEFLEDYFPAHDLDRPVLQVQTDQQDESMPVRDRQRGDRTHRMKSIRVVASEANEARKRFHGAVHGVRALNLLRRRSTRLWGAKAIEVTPKVLQRSESIVVHPGKDVPGHVTFRWLKGHLLGKGQFGHVFLAMNLTTGEMLAVKQVALLNQVTHREEAAGDVIDGLNIEIENMQDLDHANIVQYLGFERDACNVSIFLEYVSGGSVGDCLRRYGRFEPALIRSLTRQTLEGLQYLHERSILHRDLKADNLLLDIDGTCKISDFGISKRSRDVYGNDANMSMQGTIFWMAPEVVDNKKQGYSAKIDIWSLGCLVLEMFAGRRPWSSEEAISVLYTLGKGTAPPIPNDVNQILDADAEAFLAACFTIDPEERPTAERLLTFPFCKFAPEFNFAESALGRHLNNIGHPEKSNKRGF